MSTYQVLRERGDDAPERREAPAVAPSQLSQLRRYWWVVLIVTVLALVGSYLTTSEVPTTYTGRASLIVSSNNRSPDQDAVLVQGYVDYFNDPAYQDQLVRQAGLKQDVGLNARAAASSPILLIEATASSRSTAQSSAAAVAEAFQADINRVRDTQKQEQLSALRARLAAATKQGGSASSIPTLQDQIAQLEGDRTNLLQELQFRGGVSTNAPSLRTNLVFGAFGGLVLGLLAAAALAALVRAARSRRDRRSS